MIKWIGRPILLSLVAVASILGTTAITASAAPLNSTTTVTQTSPAGTAVVGQSVTYTATVTLNPVGPGQAPTGTIAFTDLGNSIPGCTSATLTPNTPTATSGSATATCTTVYTVAESGNVIATYSGDGNYNASTGTFAQTIGKDATTTTIAPASTAVVTGQTVVFTATVKAVTGTAATPTGQVTFTELGGVGSAPVPAACAPATLGAGSGGTATATCSIVFGLGSPAPTTAQIHAVYAGNANFTTSADSTDAVVTGTSAAATRVILNSSANPAVSGQALTFTATVVATAPGTGVPPGSITFSGSIGANPPGPGLIACTNLVANTLALPVGTATATCAVAAGQLVAANSPITVSATFTSSSPSTYGNSLPSTFTQTETLDSTTTTLIVNPKKALIGQPLNLTALVLNPPPGSGPITGQVSFLVTGKHTGPLNCSNLPNNFATLAAPTNEVTCELPSVPAAATPMKVVVSYFGDGNYTSSQVSKQVKLH